MPSQLWHINYICPVVNIYIKEINFLSVAMLLEQACQTIYKWPFLEFVTGACIYAYTHTCV